MHDFSKRPHICRPIIDGRTRTAVKLNDGLGADISSIAITGIDGEFWGDPRESLFSRWDEVLTNTDEFPRIRITDETIFESPVKVVMKGGKLYIIGMNFRSHYKELGWSIPDDLDKGFVCVPCDRERIGSPRGDYYIRHTDLTADTESEPGVVVRGSNVDPKTGLVRVLSLDEALSLIGGVVALDELSFRREQFPNGLTSQWGGGKGRERSLGIGDVIMLTDENFDYSKLRARSHIGQPGQLVDRQNFVTSLEDMIYSCAEIIRRISLMGLPLHAGSVISDGAGFGVSFCGFEEDGKTFKTPEKPYLGDGDITRVTLSIDGEDSPFSVCERTIKVAAA